jgi:choline dehydrogenase
MRRDDVSDAALAAPFDFVVVGGGTAGCVVAARLAESGVHRVALLEAGGPDDSFWIKAPLGYGKLYGDPRYTWRYESEPEPAWDGATSLQPRGRVLGGTGSINGMLHLRGQREDFDAWRDLGNAGWGYDDVLPFFKRFEDHALGPNPLRGIGGPVRIETMPPHPLADAFIAAALEAGYRRNYDFNGPVQDGFGYNQLTVRNGRRCSTAVAYLHDAPRRDNLVVALRVRAQRIVMRDGRAIGVEIRRDGRQAARIVTARRDVVMSCGVFDTPKLLQLSGVGPAEHLQQFGIAVVRDLPGVGANLQDHIGAGITYRCTRPITINDRVNQIGARLAMGLRYLVFRSGLMATNASYAGGCIRTDPTLRTPNVFLAMALWARSTSGRSLSLGLEPFSGFTVPFFLLHPDSRGTVRLRSADSEQAPEIRFNFFQSERDHRAALASLRIIRRIMAQPSIATLVDAEVSPSPAVSSNADLLAFLRRKTRSIHHATSSCRMGRDADAVVDARLRVRGVAHLRIVDASVMPSIVGANPNAATTMIGEKGAAMILDDEN